MQNYNSKFKIIFFGASKHVISIIKILQENFDLKLVITTEKNPTDAVPSFCLKNKIEYLSVSTLSGPNLELKIKNLELKIAVLADFGLIIPQQFLNLFSMGIINIHPSLLPKYRGPTPVQTAILNGEKTTGVTIIRLDDEIDHGPILAQKKEKILETDTSESLYERLFEMGANLLPKILPNYLNGGLIPVAQDHKQATFTPHLTRQDGYVDIFSTQLKIENLKLKIRGYFPWPGVWSNIRIKDKLLRIKLLPNYLKTQYPNDLILIQVEGKKPVNYKDFLNGYPQIKLQMKGLLE